jgi:hypothetical protein
MKKLTITRLTTIDIDNTIMERRVAQAHGTDDMQVSDGYHTMDELYEHRITLYIALCRHMHGLLGMENPGKYLVWRSRFHSDGEICFGTGSQFVLGIGKEPGKQITYHIPMEHWDETEFAQTLEIAPNWDNHTSADVLERLKAL